MLNFELKFSVKKCCKNYFKQVLAKFSLKFLT